MRAAFARAVARSVVRARRPAASRCGASARNRARDRAASASESPPSEVTRPGVERRAHVASRLSAENARIWTSPSQSIAGLAGSASSSTQWKLLPPKPKRADRRAGADGRRRGSHGPGLGVDVERRSAPARAPRSARSTLIVGGRTLWCSASAALISPAAPAAALVWPICDLTDPRAHQVPSAPRRAVDLGQRRQLGRVADLRPGAVGLDQLDRRRRDPGQPVRLPQAPWPGPPRSGRRPRSPCRRSTSRPPRITA